MHVFETVETVQKLSDGGRDLPQIIDPRGHDGVKSLEICSHWAEEIGGICVFEILNVTFLPGASTSVQKSIIGKWG